MEKLTLTILLTLLTSSLFATANYPAPQLNVAALDSSLKTPLDEKIFNKIKIQERNFVIQETAPGFRQPIYRGLQGDQLLLKVNNNIFSNSLFRSGPNQYYSYIPNEFVKNISTESDFDSISNSFGGTINRTLGIKKSRISFQNYISGGKVSTLYAPKDKDIQLGVVYKKFNYIETPIGKQQHTNYNQKGLYFESKKTSIIFTRSDDIDRPDKFLKNEPRIYSVQQYAGIFKEFDLTYDWTLKTSAQNFYEKIKDTKQNTNYYTTSNTSIYQVINNYFLTDNLLIGSLHKVELMKYTKSETSNYYTFDNNININYRNNFYNLKYNFLASADYMTIFGKLHRHFNDINTGLKLNYNNLYYSIIQGYKYPTIFNLNESISDSLTEIPNPSLNKETSLKQELYYKNHNKNISYKFTIFYNTLKDMIVRKQTTIPDGNGGYKYRIENSSRGKTYGTNARIIYSKNIFSKKLITDSFIEIVRGKTDNDYISKLTPLREATYIEYSNFFIEHKYARHSTTLSEADKNDIRIKNHNYGYNQIDIGYNFKNILTKDNLKITIKNITNNTGRVLGSSVDFSKRYIYVNYNIYAFGI